MITFATDHLEHGLGMVRADPGGVIALEVAPLAFLLRRHAMLPRLLPRDDLWWGWRRTHAGDMITFATDHLAGWIFAANHLWLG